MKIILFRYFPLNDLLVNDFVGSAHLPQISDRVASTAWRKLSNHFKLL